MTMQDMDTVLARVRKLLSLAQSSNVNEASNAAAAAQVLMTRHRIEQAMLETPTGRETQSAPTEPVERGVFREGQRKVSRWSSWLASVVADANGCKIYLIGPTIMVIGRPSDASTARYLYQYLASEIDRICERACLEHGRPGKTWAANFRLGAVETIKRRLTEANDAARRDAKQAALASDTLGNGAALVRVNNALARLDATRVEVENFVVRLGLRKGKAAKISHNATARDAGRRAGEQINLAQGRPLASGTRSALRA